MYRVTTDDESAEQVSALPVEAFVDYIAVVGVLKRCPGMGGSMRQWVFGLRGEGRATS